MTTTLTNDNDVIIQLTLIFVVSIQLSHLFQGIKHSLYDALVGSIDSPSDLKTLGAFQLAFDSGQIDGEIFDERG